MGDIFFHTLLWCLWRDLKKRRQWWCETRLHLMVVSLFKACHQLKLKVNPNTWTNHVFLLDFRWDCLFWLTIFLTPLPWDIGQGKRQLTWSSPQPKKSKKEILQGFRHPWFPILGMPGCHIFLEFSNFGGCQFLPTFFAGKMIHRFGYQVILRMLPAAKAQRRSIWIVVGCGWFLYETSGLFH